MTMPISPESNVVGSDKGKHLETWRGVGVSEELAPKSIRDEIIWSFYASLD